MTARRIAGMGGLANGVTLTVALVGGLVAWSLGGEDMTGLVFWTIASGLVVGAVTLGRLWAGIAGAILGATAVGVIEWATDAKSNPGVLAFAVAGLGVALALLTPGFLLGRAWQVSNRENVADARVGQDQVSSDGTPVGANVMDVSRLMNPDKQSPRSMVVVAAVILVLVAWMVYQLLLGFPR